MFSNLSDWLSGSLKMRSAVGRSRRPWLSLLRRVPARSGREPTHCPAAGRFAVTCQRDPKLLGSSFKGVCERKEPRSAENPVPRTLVGRFRAGRYGPAPWAVRALAMKTRSRSWGGSQGDRSQPLLALRRSDSGNSSKLDVSSMLLISMTFAAGASDTLPAGASLRTARLRPCSQPSLRVGSPALSESGTSGGKVQVSFRATAFLCDS